MESLVISFVTVLTGEEPVDGDPVYFIIPRPRAYLADLLAKSFAGRPGMEIIVDRRYAERRKGPGGGEWQQEDRRQAERRRIKQDLIEVVIERPG